MFFFSVLFVNNTAIAGYAKLKQRIQSGSFKYRFAIVMDTMEVFKTRRGKYCVSFRGYTYTERSRGNGNIYWRCRNRKTCSGTLVTRATSVSGSYPEPGEKIPHSHPPNVDAVAVARVQSVINERARSELTSVPDIYKQEQMRLLLENESAAAVLPTFR